MLDFLDHQVATYNAASELELPYLPYQFHPCPGGLCRGMYIIIMLTLLSTHFNQHPRSFGMHMLLTSYPGNAQGQYHDRTKNHSELTQLSHSLQHGTPHRPLPIQTCCHGQCPTFHPS